MRFLLEVSSYADSGSDDTFTTGNTLTFTGGEGIDTTVGDDVITIKSRRVTDSNKGVVDSHKRLYCNLHCYLER